MKSYAAGNTVGIPSIYESVAIWYIADIGLS